MLTFTRACHELVQCIECRASTVRLYPLANLNRIVERRTGTFRRRCLVADRAYKMFRQLRQRRERGDADARIAVAIDGDGGDGVEQTRAGLFGDPPAEDTERRDHDVDVAVA